MNLERSAVKKLKEFLVDQGFTFPFKTLKEGFLLTVIGETPEYWFLKGKNYRGEKMLPVLDSFRIDIYRKGILRLTWHNHITNPNGMVGIRDIQEEQLEYMGYDPKWRFSFGNYEISFADEEMDEVLSSFAKYYRAFVDSKMKLKVKEFGYLKEDKVHKRDLNGYYWTAKGYNKIHKREIELGLLDAQMP